MVHRPFLWIVATRLSLCMIYILLQSLIERLLIFSLPYPNHFLYLVIIPLFIQICKDDSLEFMRTQKNQIKYIPLMNRFSFVKGIHKEYSTSQSN